MSRSFTAGKRLAGSLAAALGFCLSLGAAPARAADPIPLMNFFKKPTASTTAVSPSGRYVAITATDGTKQRLRLLVVDLTNATKPAVLGEFDDEDILNAYWVNDDRLIFTVADRNKAIGEKGGAALLSIDREGKDQLKLLIRSSAGSFARASAVASGLVLPASYAFFRVLRDGSDDIVVAEFQGDRNRELGSVDLYRLNTKTGRTVKLTADAPDRSTGWVVDRQGRPRVAFTSSEDKGAIWWKAQPDSAWTKVREFNTFDPKDRQLDPVAVSSDGFMYAKGIMKPGDDTTSLLRFDMKSPEIAPVYAAGIAGYDFEGSLVVDSKGVVKGIHYLSDAQGTLWLDPALKKIQEDVDRRLPGLINTIQCGGCDQPTTVVVRSYSDRQPTQIYFYDSVAGKFVTQLKTRPWIEPRNMAKQVMETLTARDGLTIPVLVTRPVGVTGPAPTVVLVHGGPWVRGVEWHWSPDTQFLASRGYVVVEPAFRGSIGFGNKLFRASWKQWGLSMQDDVADATTWAIQKGYSDPKRVCIAGASYGGYATLMGLIRYPEMYRCGIEWVGVSDIDLMYSITWSDFSDTYKTYGMPVLVGDRVKDADQLARTSPIRRAAELKQPLLMGYGGADVRVPVEHGTAMRSALLKTNNNVEWVVYPQEGHGWVRDDSNADWWSRVERFLDRNLKAAAP